MSSLIFSLVFLIILLIIFFAIVDKFLKGGKKIDKKTESIKIPEKSSIETVSVENKNSLPTMKIYNSELADDLSEILKSSQNETSSRLKIENRSDKENNIAKYIKSKNYRSFDFNTEETANTDTEKELSFTLEDYKRIMAISNIDDKK